VGDKVLGGRRHMLRECSYLGWQGGGLGPLIVAMATMLHEKRLWSKMHGFINIGLSVNALVLGRHWQVAERYGFVWVEIMKLFASWIG
jgi:hypothetical protein